MNRWLVLVLLVLLMAIVGAPVAFAQHDHPAPSAQASAPEAQTDPMQECQKHRAESAAAIDQASATLSQAEQLTDPDQLKAAIESAKKSIAEAKHHLSMCPMAHGGKTDQGIADHSQHTPHKMKCMSKVERVPISIAV